MSQTALTLPPPKLSGAALTEDISAIAKALASCRSGTARPADVQTPELWIQTTETTWSLNIWTGTQDVLVATINPSTGTVDLGDAANADKLGGYSLSEIIAQAQAGTAAAAANAAALNGLTSAEIVAEARAGVAKTDEVTAYTKQQRATPIVLTDVGGTLTLDAQLHQVVEINATSALTLASPMHAVMGDSLLMCLRAGTALGLTWAPCFKANADVALDVACVANKRLYLNFFCIDGANWLLLGRVAEA